MLLVNVPDPIAVLREAARIVRPGGAVVVQEVDWLSWQCEPGLPAWAELRDVLLEVWHFPRPRSRDRAAAADAAAHGRVVRGRGDGRAGIDGAGHPYRRSILTFADRCRDRILTAGLATADELDELGGGRRSSSGRSGHRGRAGDDRAGVGPRRAAGVSSLVDDRSSAAGDRFGALSATFDGWTRAHLDACGLAPGWACWEVGPGGPAVPAWLADRVGPTGRVVATDLDTSWLPTGAAFSVERLDVAADPPPDGLFDLIHARLVLTHVPQRDEALRRMAGALRPGGWLVIEDFDVSVQPRACPDAATPEEDRANRMREGLIELLVQRGVDLTLGRTLRRRLLGLGLADIGAEAYARWPCRRRAASRSPTRCGSALRSKPSAAAARSTPTSRRSPPGASTSPPRRSSRRGVGTPERTSSRTRNAPASAGASELGRKESNP